MKISVAQQSQSINCVYCREPLGDLDIVHCLRCQTAMHADCSVEVQGKCPILGCVGDMELTQSPMVSISSLSKSEADPARDHRVDFAFPVWLPLLIFFSIIGSFVSMIAMLLYETPIAFDIGVLSTFVICGMLFYQNLRQARALETPLTPGAESLEAYENRLVALRGPMESDYPPLVTPHDAECLWYKHITRRFSNLETRRKNRDQFDWIDVEDECGEYCRPFRVGEVTVSNEITEPSGYKEKVRSIKRKQPDVDSVGDLKDIIQFLEAGTEVTAVGRLFKEGKSWVLRRDMTGLILTTTPREVLNSARRNVKLSLGFFLIYACAAYFWMY
ncbi:MAG: hypothetical protein P1V97_18405 [Planctomycetota bacterium]|nr:hypothetical protein [Planctomycetota bacterium]